jgi:hypothetical protein
VPGLRRAIPFRSSPRRLSSQGARGTYGEEVSHAGGSAGPLLRAVRRGSVRLFHGALFRHLPAHRGRMDPLRRTPHGYWRSPRLRGGRRKASHELSPLLPCGHLAAGGCRSMPDPARGQAFAWRRVHCRVTRRHAEPAYRQTHPRRVDASRSAPLDTCQTSLPLGPCLGRRVHCRACPCLEEDVRAARPGTPLSLREAVCEGKAAFPQEDRAGRRPDRHPGRRSAGAADPPRGRRQLCQCLDPQEAAEQRRLHRARPHGRRALCPAAPAAHGPSTREKEADCLLPSSAAAAPRVGAG